MELEEALQSDAALQIENTITAYERAIENINRDIRYIFKTFTENGGISEEEARRLLNSADSDEIYQELLKLLKQTDNSLIQEEIMGRINAQAYGARISRLEGIKQKIYIQLRKVANYEVKKQTMLYTDTLKRSYYSNIYYIAEGIDCGIDFALLPQRAIDTALWEPWSGRNYSMRIWNNNDKFIRRVQASIEDGLIEGHSIQRMADTLQEFVLREENTAARLVRTETAYFLNEGQRQAYEEIGIKKYRYVAALSERTCENCAELDGNVYDVSQSVVGTNYPPMHPNCRCSTIMDGVLPSTRNARDPLNGRNNKIDGSKTFREWKDSLSKEQHQAMELHVQHMRTKSVDQKQYERYVSVLGRDGMPKTFEKFQEMKYNDSEKWSDLKRRYNYENKPYLQEQLSYTINGEKNFIPDKTIISTAKTIAGAGSKTTLRVEKRLVENYGGHLSEWKKRVGKIESEKYVFDVHWYELDRKQYHMKLKHRGDKK